MGGLSGGLSNPNSYGNGCYLDGVPTDCTRALLMLNHGAAELDPWLHRRGRNLPPDAPIAPVKRGEYERPGYYYYGDLAPGGQQTTTINPQNGTDAERERFKAALDELMKALGANNGKNTCAELFGGYDKAMKTLKETKWKFEAMGAPATSYAGTGNNAVTKGKEVRINSQGGFMSQDGRVTTLSGETAFVVALIPGEKPGEVVPDPFTDGVVFAAFVLLHELGHRSGIYGKDDEDGKDDKNGTALEKVVRNNKKLYEACYGWQFPK
jgi:hypothetical protein